MHRCWREITLHQMFRTLTRSDTDRDANNLMYGSPCRPERLPQAAERTISQENLRAALAIARNVHETDQAHQQAEPGRKIN